MELRELTHDRFEPLRSRLESWVPGDNGEPFEERNHEVERILLLRSASLELHRILTGS